MTKSELNKQTCNMQNLANKAADQETCLKLDCKPDLLFIKLVIHLHLGHLNQTNTIQ